MGDPYAGPVDLDVEITQIVELAEEVGDQFGIVGDVFKAANGFELAGQVIGDLANRGVGIEAAVPGTTILVIEPISTRARVRECGIGSTR